MRILLVEDEKELADALEYILEKQGYIVDCAYDGDEGEAFAQSGIYDAIVLDRMLPGMEGLEILRAIRKKKQDTPVMFLTARDSIHDRVEGLEAGADDYLIKPFSNQEFVARVKALTRRRSMKQQKNILEIAGTRLDTLKNIYEINGNEIDLTKTETQLLEYLINNKNQVLQKEQILNKIWGFNKDVEIANVELYIFYLRKKIDFNSARLELKTIRGNGYSLVENRDSTEKR